MYQTAAKLLLSGAAVFDKSSPLATPDVLSHPPGYPVLLAAVFRLFGESDAAVQIVQITCDALAATIVFLIARELLSKRVAVIAGILVALAPQFAYNSVMLLPDSLAVLPIVLAIYCLVRALRQHHSLSNIIARRRVDRRFVLAACERFVTRAVRRRRRLFVISAHCASAIRAHAHRGDDAYYRTDYRSQFHGHGSLHSSLHR